MIPGGGWGGGAFVGKEQDTNCSKIKGEIVCMCVCLSVCQCISVCLHNNGLPGQKNIAKLGVSQTAIFGFFGFMPLFLCLLFLVFKVQNR
jgi:hypothetical protein